MQSVQIQLTTKCNERCFMCRKYTWEKKEIPYEVLFEKINKYKEANFTFSGGDPLEYSELEALTELLVKNNIRYQVFTNMNYDLTPAMEGFLQNAECIQVSLDGSTEDAYNFVRRPVENGLMHVIRNIKRFSLKVKANCTVSNRNYFDVVNIYNLAKQLDVPIRFFPVHTHDNAALNMKMYEKMIENCKVLGEKLPKEIQDLCSIMRLGRPPFYSCWVKTEHRLIDESGREYPCCRAINDNGEDWDGKYSVENLESIDDESVLYPFCKGCDRYVKFNTNKEEYKGKVGQYL